MESLDKITESENVPTHQHDSKKESTKPALVKKQKAGHEEMPNTTEVATSTDEIVIAVVDTNTEDKPVNEKDKKPIKKKKTEINIPKDVILKELQENPEPNKKLKKKVKVIKKSAEKAEEKADKLKKKVKKAKKKEVKPSKLKALKKKLEKALDKLKTRLKKLKKAKK